MFKKSKMFIAGFLSCMILFGIVTVYAAGDAQIKAVLLNTFKYKLNGKDFNSSAKPIVYNNTYYVPVDAIVRGIGVPVDTDKAQKTIWLGGKTLEIAVDNANLYQDYYGSIITKDAGKLTTPLGNYKWGITNGKKLSMSYFGCYLKPNAKYKKFKASIYMDPNVKTPLVMEFRKDSYNGEVMKSITLQPGEKTDVDIGIGGVQKFCILSNILIGHGEVEKIVIGNPIFSNKPDETTAVK